jgi:hypothetical protein
MVMLSVAFIPQFYIRIIGNVLMGMIPLYADMNIIEGYVKTISGISLYSLLLIAIAVAIWLARSIVMRQRSQRIDTTWGCGYTAPTSRIQYTGKSFSKPLGKILNFLLIENKHFDELKPGEIFPEKKSYVSHYHDFIERNLIDPVLSRLNYSVNYFSFIQNGRIQSYVLYGIVFILAILILTIFNFVS